MPQLICTYASERSQPEKIQRWITDLTEMREACEDDPVRTAMIDLLLGRARGWLEAKGVELAV